MRRGATVVIEALLVLLLWQVVWNGNDIILQKLLHRYSVNTQAVLYFIVSLLILLLLYTMEGRTFNFLDDYGL